MSVIKIPLNTLIKKDNSIIIDGLKISNSMWSSVLHVAYSLYENGTLDDDTDFEYGVSEIFESLREMSENKFISGFESSCYDPQVDALFDLVSDLGVKIIIEYGQRKQWEF